MACATAVMMREPPQPPTSIMTEPSGSSTMVGDMDDSMRFPGAIALASHWTRPNMFAVPGWAAKSSISLFMKKPASGTQTPEP